MASSSSTTDNIEHDVFLSFRGEDTRYNFTSHLCASLLGANIKVFIERMLDIGEVLTPALHKAIERSKISVIIFSSDYTSSSFCLDELVKILECKESKAQNVLPIFYKVNPSDLRKLKGTYEKAFAKHEAKFKGKRKCGEEAREEELKVQRWKSALQEAANLKGRHVDDNCDEAETIREITLQISKKLNCERTSKSKGQELISTPLVGDFTAKNNMKKIWSYLIDDKICRVGIYGMGGVGKTTIATHINNQLKRANTFQHVYWVTVSKESSIYKLQSDIAKEIDLDLSREEDERKRAAKLWEALNDKKRFVLILDDMWESFELEEVGIPISADGGKLLLTTREHRVCKRMKCEGIVKVAPLLKREARDLFIRESGHQIEDNPELRNIVESVIKECDGLPLAIKVIARSTRGFAENYEWRNILKELQKPSDRQNHDMEKVFNLLKVSYDRLQNDKYRQCLHYCAMFPEDHIIPIDDLINYSIAGGLIDELDSGQEEMDMVNTIINGLIDASLLERVNVEVHTVVKMHDVVRDMVLSITRGKLMVKAHLLLQDFPKFSDWSANLEGISIMKNYTLKECSFNSAPNCYKLKILLMQNNKKLSALPNCFFVHMQNLTILDISYLKSLKLLPDSISKLEALRMLNLNGCSSLEYIPSLGALKDLRHLDLSRTNLKSLPEGMEKLVNLKLLCIIMVKALCASIPCEVLKKLSLLQTLHVIGSNLEVDPEGLSSLQKLETLRVEFENFDALNLYLESRHWERLRSYGISNNKEEFYGDGIMCDRLLIWCNDSSLDSDSAAGKKESTGFVIPFNVEQLTLMKWDGPLDGPLINGCFAFLKKLTLIKCELNYLVSVDFAKQLLQNLEELLVRECAYIEEIIGTNNKNYPTIEFPKLKMLCLHDLPRLTSIYRGKMEFPSLDEVSIYKCKKLETPPFHLRRRAMHELNSDSRSSWSLFQSGDENYNQVFEEYMRELGMNTDSDFYNSEPEAETEIGCLDLTLKLLLVFMDRCCCFCNKFVNSFPSF